MSPSRGSPRDFLLRSLLGPLAYFPHSWRAGLALILAVLLLTLVTQVGGLMLWLLLPLLERLHALLWQSVGRYAGVGIFAVGRALYTFLTVTVVPPLAALFGREALPCQATSERPYGAVSSFYCFTGRRYAAPGVADSLEQVSRDFAKQFPGSRIAYLDASFPFFDGFPLLPHLSHDDGLKVDLAFFYLDGDRRPRPEGGAWPLGYWAYSGPLSGEAQPCRADQSWLSLRWDMTWLQPLFQDLSLDRNRTRALIELLLKQPEARRIFLEPHLTARLGLKSQRIRFQGCRAARHDDHLHIGFRF